MRNVAASVFVVAFAAVTAEGGVVSFTQVSVDLVPETPDVLDVLPGTPAAFNVGLASTVVTTFESVGMDIGSNSAGLDMSFAYDATFNPTIPPLQPFYLGIWPMDLFVGGSRFVLPTDPTAWRAPLLIGQLTIQTTGMAVGSSFDVFVDGPRELNFFGAYISEISPGFPAEGLQGFGHVHIVPEPGTLSLLGLLDLIRRRLVGWQDLRSPFE